MKLLKATTALLVVGIVLVPAVAPAATTADLQSQTIGILRQIVDLQQQLISTLEAQVAQLQAEINSLTGQSTYSQWWPLQRTLDEKSIRQLPMPLEPTPVRTAAATGTRSTTSALGGGSCTYNGLTYPDGATRQQNTCLPSQLCNQGSTTYVCHSGSWSAVGAKTQGPCASGQIWCGVGPAYECIGPGDTWYQTCLQYGQTPTR